MQHFSELWDSRSTYFHSSDSLPLSWEESCHFVLSEYGMVQRLPHCRDVTKTRLSALRDPHSALHIFKFLLHESSSHTITINNGCGMERPHLITGKHKNIPGDHLPWKSISCPNGIASSITVPGIIKCITWKLKWFFPISKFTAKHCMLLKLC